MINERSLYPLILNEASWEVPEAELAQLSGKRHRYALVIPVINEGERIRRQLRALADLAPALDVIVADGGSTDGSLDLDFLEGCGVRALLVKRGPGRLSAQLRMAYAWALQEGYEGIVTVDGNGKDGIDALPRFIEALEAGVDYVQGSRYRKGGAAINTPLDRKIAGRLIHAPLLSFAAGQWFTDTTNGFRGYSRRYLLDPRVAPFRDRFDRYNLLFYLSLRAGQLGYRSLEIPVRRSYPAGEKPPTKISGFSGRVSMMSELLRCTLGGCTPPSSQPFSGRGYNSGSGEASTVGLTLLLALAGLFVVVSRLLPLVFPHDPWLDEAMLMANLPLPALSALFEPLPLFEQAAPLGYLVLVNAVTLLFPEEPALALRCLSVLASLAAAWMLYLMLRRLMVGYAAVLAFALVCLSSFAVVYSVEIKQYIFEFLAAVLMMHAAIRLLQHGTTKSLYAFIAAGVVSILISFTAPIVIAAVGIGLGVQAWVMRWAIEGCKERGGSGPVAIALALGFLALVFLLVYFGYVRPATEIQLSAFAEIYDRGILAVPPRTLEEIEVWYRFPEFAFTNIAGAWMDAAGQVTSIGPDVVLLLFVISLILGLIETLRRFVFLPVASVTAALAVFVLGVVGLLPITVERHFAFMVPFLGAIVGLGLFRCIFWLTMGGVGRAALAARGCLTLLFVAAIGATAVSQATNLARQEVSPLIAYIKAHNENNAPVWLYYGAQPAMRVIAPEGLEQIGLVSHASSPTGWVWKHRIYPETVNSDPYLEDFRNTLHGLPEVWLLFSHHLPIEEVGLFILFGIAEEEVGGCREVLADVGTLLLKCG